MLRNSRVSMTRETATPVGMVTRRSRDQCDGGASAWAQTCTNEDWVQDIWTCGCWTCRGRTLEWMATAAEAEVNAHTFEILGELRDGLSALPAGRIRERSWTSKCNAAISRYDELRLGLRIGWEAPGYLRSWAAV
jgi:hypothetical protein